MELAFRQHIENLLGQKISLAHVLSSGDSNQVICLNNLFVLKINRAANGSSVLTSEREGLNQLTHFQLINTPRILHYGLFESHSFIITDYIRSSQPTPLFWENFGTQLAQLHMEQAEIYGHGKPNFIGSLSQSNNQHTTWASFFKEERLRPQLTLAIDQGHLLNKDEELFYSVFKRLSSILPNDKASPIHGDLWNGNFICAKNETPYLIDPSFAIAHREMDIAMSLLFGGFDDLFYNAYNTVFPLEKEWKSRMSLLQIYYLLVHLNLFGSSYYNMTLSQLKKYA